MLKKTKIRREPTTTTIYVRPSDYKRLVKIASEQDRSVASVVTLAIDALSEKMAGRS